jgi:ATP-binding cassette subfamily B protein
MWKHAAGYRASVVVYLIMSALAIAVQLMAPMVMAQLMNDLQVLSGPKLADQAWHLLMSYFLIGLLFWFLHGPSRVMETTISFWIKQVFQDSLMRRVTALPMSWHKDHHSGQIIDQVARAVGALGEFAEGGFELLHMFARFFGSIALLTWFAPNIGIGMMVIAFLVGCVIIFFDRILVPQYEQLNRSYNKVAAAIQDYLTNISTVLSLRLEDRVVGEISKRTLAIYPLYRKNNVVNELKWFSTSRVIDGAQAGLLLYLILSLSKGDQGIKVGSVYAVSEYLKILGEVFFTFTWKYGRVVGQSARVRAIQHIEEAYDQLVGQTADAHLPDNWTELEIQGLSFQFAPSDEPAEAKAGDGPETVSQPKKTAPGLVIEQLKLRRGVRYAVVGESGGGKSTFLALLRGIHQPAVQPTVTCDGVALPFGLHHVNHHATLIPQHPEIFSDTILFNVTMGVPCENERVLEALRLARFEKVLSRLENGLETNIAEKGVNLSGGERQRLALARGIFFEAEIHSGLVLLDEPTSSVDAQNEKLIYQNLLEQFSDRCVLSALHKFHLLPLFDQIMVFEEGRLVQMGPTAEILAQPGLWNAELTE